MAKCTLTTRNRQAIKMSQSSFPVEGWRGLHVPWLLAVPILLSLIKGAASQCDPMIRPLTLRVVNESTNILSTDYLRLPSRNINCQWKITANEGDRIALTVINIDLTSSYAGANQNIQIFDGETEYNRSLGIFCGRQRGQVLFSSARFMLIKFLSTNSLGMGRFNLNYTREHADSACRPGTRPARLTGSVYYFKDLRFSSSGTYYSNNALCDWLISVPNGYVVQLRVNSINMDTSSGCIRNRMDIYDGTTDSYSLASICRNYSQTVNSSGTNMLIRFTSDSLVTRSGFNVSYKAILSSTTTDSACWSGTRPTRLTGSTSYFTDLHFPRSSTNYSNNAICDWLISVPNGYVVQLRVNSVNMEESTNCTWDRMDIYDGTTVNSRSLARICRYYYYQTVYSTGTNMLIHFTSDISVTGTGFSVNYKAVLKSSVTTTTAYTYYSGYSDYVTPSIWAIASGLTFTFFALLVLGVITYQCRRKSSRSPARRSNAAVATRDNVSSRNQRTQTAPQDRHDVYTLPTALPTTTAPFFTNCGYSTLGDQAPTAFPPRNILAGGNQNPPTKFTGIGPPEYSYAPPSYSEVVNGCYTPDS